MYFQQLFWGHSRFTVFLEFLPYVNQILGVHVSRPLWISFPVRPPQGSRVPFFFHFSQHTVLFSFYYL